MLILFDQGTPVPIRAYMVGHTVRTAFEQGWSMLRNGDLLAAAEAAGFDLLLTTDKNIRHQQNLTNRRIAIVVLGQQQWPKLHGYVNRIAEAVDRTLPGTYVEIDIPSAAEA